MSFTTLLRQLDWWLVLLVTSIAAVGVATIHSATATDTNFSGQASRQVLFFCVAGVAATLTLAIPYARIHRAGWWIYGLSVLALAGLPFFGVIINGARRWYRLPGFNVQPSEFAKISVIIALASWLRFRVKARTFEGLIVPVLLTALPVGLILKQPDLGSSLVFWPILLAMCYAAGTPKRPLLILIGAGVLGLVLAYMTVLHDYQKERVDVWRSHFAWSAEDVSTPEVQRVLRGPGFQPWQSLIAIGGGGTTGFGYKAGPQSQFDFLPYRSGDYVFAVIAEEGGLSGAALVILLEVLLFGGLCRIAIVSRERFGRLIAVGVAAYIGTQSLLHIAVCAWFVPATGLPMPLVSYGGSSVLSSMIALALALNVGARRQTVLAADGYS